VEITGIGCHVRGCTSVHVPVAAGELQVVEGSEESRVDLRLLVGGGDVGALSGVRLWRHVWARAKEAG
jgi:hypothetical protein